MRIRESRNSCVTGSLAHLSSTYNPEGNFKFRLWWNHGNGQVNKAKCSPLSPCKANISGLLVSIFRVKFTSENRSAPSGSFWERSFTWKTGIAGCICYELDMRCVGKGRNHQWSGGLHHHSLQNVAQRVPQHVHRYFRMFGDRRSMVAVWWRCGGTAPRVEHLKWFLNTGSRNPHFHW